MGDRGNIVSKWDDDNKIYFYTHWTGSDIKEILQRALKIAKEDGRLHDYPYLNRIIFCQLVPVKYWEETTGYGISTELCDNEHPILTLDVKTQTIYIGDNITVSVQEYLTIEDLSVYDDIDD